MPPRRRLILCSLLAVAALIPSAAAAGREAPPDYFIACDPDSFTYIYDNWWLDHEVPCQLTIDGVTWPDCRLRIRGDSSRQYPKKSLKIKTDGADFPDGNDVLNFNADWLDRSYLRTVLATTVFKRAGVPCFDAAHARLHLNGEFLGLYIRVQNMDAAFLAANGLDPSGNLYKATHDGASLTPEEDLHALWEKKTNEDGDWSDLEALVADLAAVSDPDFAAWAAGALDLPEVTSLVACNALLGNGSTYYHNYYMYRDPAGTGVWSVFPWDLDKTFAGYGATYNYDRTSTSQLPDNPLPEHFFTSPAAFQLFHDRVDELVDTIFNLAFFDPLIDSLRTSIEASVAADETDDVASTLAWNAAIGQERSIGVTFRTSHLQDQLEHAPRVCRLERRPDALQDDVTLSWHPSLDPDGGPLTYTLRYCPDLYFVAGNTVTVTGLVDTAYTLPTAPADSVYYWQVFANDEDPGHVRQGTDSVNTFVVDHGSVLLPLVTDDLILDAAGSPWFADRDVTVEAGATLTVEAGTEVRLAAGVSIIVRGRLVAAGRPDQPIRFRPQLAGAPWGALCCDRGADPSILTHVRVQGATRKDDDHWQAAVSAWATGLYLTGVEFDGCQQSVHVQGGDLTAQACRFLITNGPEMLKVQAGTAVIEACTFALPAGDGDAVDLDALTSGTVRGCTFLGGHQGDDLVDLGSGCTDLLLADNLFTDAFDNGISVGEGSQVTLRGNVISGCAVGVAVKDASVAVLERNTLHGNGTGLRVYEKTAGWGGGQADVASAILAASTTAALSVDAQSTATVRYSLADTELLAGPGNLQADPLLVDPAGGDFQLQAGSPCINAGDPDAAPDPDGTRADMGAFYRDLALWSVVINEINYNAAADFEPGDWVELHNPTELAVDLGGVAFHDEGHAFPLPAGTVIPPGGYLVLAEDLALFQALFPDVDNVLGDLAFGFAGSGELLQLIGDGGAVIDQVLYDDAPPWPVEPDGTGPTLELRDPGLDNSLAASWTASTGHGTPGAVNGAVITDVPPAAWSATALEAVYPSPFNPRCTVRFALAEAGRVQVAAYDVRGRRVAVLLDERRAAGRHEVSWQGRDGRGRSLASGAYMVRLSAGEVVDTRKVLLVR